MWIWGKQTNNELEGVTQMLEVWVTCRLKLKLFSRSFSEPGVLMHVFHLSHSQLQQPQLNYLPKFQI